MRPLRPILPASRGSRNSSHPPLRRDRVASACDECRARKTKCNGARPQCLECAKRSTTCHYAARSAETPGQALKRKLDELQAQNEAYTELFGIIQSSPECESHEILRRIKMGDGVERVLRHVKEADLLVQLTLIPETRRRYTLPYSTSMPAFLLVPDNPYLASPMYEVAFNQPNRPSSSTTTTTDLGQYHKPNYAAEIIEPLLDRVCAKDWTTIISDDGLFRRLLALYLFHQHTTHYCFNKDLFLQDMAARSSAFCSKLLVNAVLAAGCQVYKGIPELNKIWMPENLQNRFLLEAKRLWELDQGNSRMTTIHAATVLHNTLNGNGMDKEGGWYTREAITIARNIRLFDRPSAHLSARTRRGQEYTAWAFWSWQATVGYQFRHVPGIKDPPGFPAPDPAADPAWYGEIYVRYPLSPTLTPIYFGHLMKASLGMRIITNDLTVLRFGGPGQEDLSNEQLLDFISRLESWQKDLPIQLSPQNISLPSQFKIQ